MRRARKITMLVAAAACTAMTAMTAMPASPPAAASTAPAKEPIYKVSGTLDNQTDRVLTLRAAHLDWGCWTNGQYPPNQIMPKSRGYWEARGCGPFTGTEGNVTYNLENTGGQGYAYAHWNLPYWGSNSFDAQAGGLYRMTASGDNRPSTTAHYTLTCIIPGC